MASFMALYAEDMQEIDGLAKRVEGYKNTLEEICAQPYQPGTAEQLRDAYSEMGGAIRLGRKYSDFGKEMRTGHGSDRVEQLVNLSDLFYGKACTAADEILKRFETGKRVVEGWDKRKDDIGELTEAKHELGALAEDYAGLSEFDIGSHDRKMSGLRGIVEDYSGFIRERKPFDEKLDRVRIEVDSGACHGAKARFAEGELGRLEKAYSELERKYSGLRMRLAGRDGIFGCAEQKARIGRLYGEIRGTEVKGKNGPGRGINPEEEKKALDAWIWAYRNSLKRINGGSKITSDYVEELCGTELADSSIAERIKRDSSLTDKLGRFLELDLAVRNQLERELSRVEDELNRREKMYEEELGAQDYNAGGGKGKEGRENIELLLSATYELSKMRKRCGLATDGTERIKGELERRLVVCQKEKQEQKREIVVMQDYMTEPGNRRCEPDPEKEGRFGTYQSEDGAHEAKEAIIKICGRYLSNEVIDPEGIRDLFDARDYCSRGGARGSRINNAEIETLMGSIYAREREKIEGFIRRCRRMPLDEETIREAAYYRKIMDEWEMRLGG